MNKCHIGSSFWLHCVLYFGSFKKVAIYLEFFFFFGHKPSISQLILVSHFGSIVYFILAAFQKASICLILVTNHPYLSSYWHHIVPLCVLYFGSFQIAAIYMYLVFLATSYPYLSSYWQLILAYCVLYFGNFLKAVICPIFGH